MSNKRTTLWAWSAFGCLWRSAPVARVALALASMEVDEDDVELDESDDDSAKLVL